MKKAKKSVLVLLTVLLCVSTLLAACSAGDDKEKPAVDGVKEKIKLDFWTFWGSTTRRPIIEKLISDFNASQDKIFVKHTYLPFGDVWTKEFAAIAAGNPPDVIIGEIGKVAQRADKKQVVNLSKYLAKDNIQDRFFTHLWEPMKYKNEVYAIPFNTDTYFLFYNKAMFKEAGLDPEKPPKTWAELEEMSKKLDKINNGKIERLGFHPRIVAGHEYFMLNADGGKPWVDEKGVNINTPNKLAALKWFNSWDERLGMKEVDAFKGTFGSKTNEPLLAGKVAMIVKNGTFWTQIRDFAAKKEDYGVAPLPEYKAGSGHTTTGGGFTIEIPQGAKNPDASWEFIKFMTDVDSQKYWAQMNYENVANIKASNDPELMADPIYKFSVQNLKDTVLGVTPLSAPDFGNLLNPEIEAVILGKQTAEQALEKAQKAVENLVNQNKK
jgi:multiple sugar transport system substrate-binding protein